MASCCPELRFQQRTPLPNRMLLLLLRRWLRFPATLPRPWKAGRKATRWGLVWDGPPRAENLPMGLTGSGLRASLDVPWWMNQG